MILISVRLAQRMLGAFWYGQWETRNAAENKVCAYGCGEPYQDFVAHDADCRFVAEWTELADVRAALADTHEVVIAAEQGGRT